MVIPVQHAWVDTEFDTEIFQQLTQLTHSSRFETIRGIVFDLRHPALDPEEWRTGTLFWQDFDPICQFPWSDVKDIRRRRRYSGAKMPPIVREGDKVTIGKIHRIVHGSEFDHLHDSEYRELYVEVIKPNGKTILTTTPIRFYGQTRMTGGAYISRISVGKMLARICKHFNISAINDFELIGEEYDLEQAALYDAKKLVELREPLRSELPDDDNFIFPRNQKSRQSFDLLIDTAISLGYTWAQAEAEQRLRPFAEAGLKSKRGGGVGGKRSGEARRQKAVETWQPHALELALNSREQFPENSQDDVVADIQALWKHDNPKCPGTRTLKSFISSQERAGNLPKRNVK